VSIFGAGRRVVAYAGEVDVLVEGVCRTAVCGLAVVIVSTATLAVPGHAKKVLAKVQIENMRICNSYKLLIWICNL
jgi:hypothetical protein